MGFPPTSTLRLTFLSLGRSPHCLLNSRIPLVTATCSITEQAWVLHKIPHYSRLDAQSCALSPIAEFPELDSPERLGLLSQRTCVGSRYERRQTNPSGFHGLRESPKIPVQGSRYIFTQFSSLRDSPSFNAWPSRRRWFDYPEAFPKVHCRTAPEY